MLTSVRLAPVHAMDQGKEIIGSWRFTAALDTSEIAALDEREARQLVGRVLTIDKDRVELGSRICSAPSLETEWVEPRLYLLEQAHASSQKLGLPNPVAVVELGCTIAFIKNPNQLIVHWKGWFYDAERVPRPVPFHNKREK
ncbi:hypothetical protein [Massilia endophytica]|uniref:hypothetical protein n=1 Tax=Massilia endophytica TaxID=2899220 RepID=UPI001E505528|nr:hypothetical protein [Massilia endophytica]UGQ45118.1 hypothetical protein LSQ66_15095 [Massilia endophytica]